MPSKYEPCGLNQIYSLRYGTIPVVRATGGLDDTITHYDPSTGKGNGFKFKNYDAKELLEQRLDKPWETREYYEKLIQEGHTKITIPDLPTLNDKNVIVMDIWNMMQVMGGISLDEAAEILGITLTKTEKYFIVRKLIACQGMLNEYIRKKNEIKPGHLKLG